MTKRFFFLTFIVLNIGISIAQTTRTHTVQRGESLDFIAKKYNVAVNDIKAINSFQGDFFYVGQILRLPEESHTVSVQNSYSDLDYAQSLIYQAAKFESEQKYSQAQKIYKKILKQNNNTYIHFLYGRCCYLSEKWKDAIKEFELVSKRKDCSEEVIKSTKALLVSAQEKRDEQLRIRRQTWGEIGSMLAVTAMSVTNSALTTSSSTNSFNSNTGNLDYLLNPNYAIMQTQQQLAQEQAIQQQLITASIKQVEQQEQQEYLQAKQFRPNLTIEQFKLEKAKAYQIMKEAESISETSNHKNTDSSSSHSHQFCKRCSNTGVCPQCGGDGRLTDTMFGTGKSLTEKCGICGGSGRCPYCKNS